MAQAIQTLQRAAEKLSFVKIFFWILRILTVVVVVWGSYLTLQTETYSNSQWGDFLKFGISQGSVYSLIALGYTMVYGILRFINFAHGEVFMSGTIVGFYVTQTLTASGLWDSAPILALMLTLFSAMLTSVIVAVLVERIAYRPLRNAPRLIPLITSIGMSFILQQIFRGLFGSGVKTYPTSSFLEGKITFLGIELLKTQAMVIGTSFIMMAGLYLFIEKTKTGKAIRAVAEDKEIAALMGINVDRMIVITFIIGGLLAGTAGTLYGLVFRNVNYFSGFLPGIKAFTATVLGGIGNIFGAMVGGLVLGIAESIGPVLILTGFNIPAPHQLKDVVAFMVLVLVLIFKPTGLMGEHLTDEKA